MLTRLWPCNCLPVIKLDGRLTAGEDQHGSCSHFPHTLSENTYVKFQLHFRPHTNLIHLFSGNYCNLSSTLLPHRHSWSITTAIAADISSNNATSVRNTPISPPATLCWYLAPAPAAPTTSAPSLHLGCLQSVSGLLPPVSQSQGLILSSALEPIPARLVERNTSGQFIEM